MLHATNLQAWSISGGGASGRVRPTSLQLQPRPVNLKDFKACTFVDVRHSTAGGFYAITSNGILVMMKPSLRGVDKSVNLQVGSDGQCACRPPVCHALLVV
jgi:hypothetical protein